MDTLNVGIIGCGKIFPAYVKGCRLFRKLNLIACSDISPETAAARAKEFEVEARSIEQMLSSDDIDMVINLTIPKVHAQVTLNALEAGKHVHSEKPLAAELADGQKIVETAAKKNLRVGCAPDTFLGAGLQTCRKLIDDGWIGRPVSGTAFMLSPGVENWHPNPGFYYQRGGGPMFDMGPYYITALVHLLGPVRSVIGTTSRAWNERVATSETMLGVRLPVEVPTHYSGSLVFENGAVINMVMSFDVAAHTHSPIELYGTEGSMAVPDPNTFGGPVSVFRKGQGWKEVPLLYDYAENSRGIGAADIAHAVAAGRAHRCNARMALHALEVMHAFERSQESAAMVEIESDCEQPAPFPSGMVKGLLDE